jgi:hypothetical protein
MSGFMICDPFALTVLRSVSGKHASKRFTRKKDGEVGNRSYGSEKYFAVESIAVRNIAELAQALERLTNQTFAFVIRGEPLPGINRKHTRRLLYPEKSTGDAATFREAKRHWFLVDGDHIPCPVTIDPKSDPEGAVEYVIGLLPPELYDATCWWQWSSSQGVLASDDTLSLHLWFWGLEALADAELKRWALAANRVAGFKLIDDSLYRAVQPHYIAAPSFEGLTDPLPRRYGLRQGLDDAVSLLIPEPHPKRPEEPLGEGYEPGLGIDAYLAKIGGTKGFRGPIMAALASYIAIYGSNTDVQPIYQAIREAIARAEPDGDLGRYADDTHLDKITDWIRQHHGDQPPKRFHAEPPPHIVDPDIPAPEEEVLDTRPPEFSDDALALRFSNAHGDCLRHVALWGRWLQWNGTYWEPEETLRTFDLARVICRKASARVSPDQTKLAAAIASAKTVAAVERLARADRRHAATVKQWDSDPAAVHHPEEEP